MLAEKTGTIMKVLPSEAESQKLREALALLMRERGITQVAASRSLGLSTTTLSLWLNNDYNADDKNIVDKVQNFIKRETDKDLAPVYSSDFIETSVSKSIFEITRKCHLQNKIGVIYGLAGLGKTTAVTEYSEQHHDVILLKVNLSYKPKVLFQKLSKVLNLPISGSIHEMLEAVIEKLKNSGRLIIIDEAENLNYQSLELMRAVYDEAKIGIVLIGMPKLYYNLQGKRGEYAQLYSRAYYKSDLNLLTEEDVKLIVANAIPESNGIWEVFFDYSQGNARMLANLLERSIDKAKSTRRPLTPEIIKASAKLLYVEMYKKE